jgi:hypothetical protein
MKLLRRYSQVVWLICYCMFGFVAVGAAHDCSGPSDCGVIPPNVDIATGIGAVVAGGAMGWALVRQRIGKPRSPCQELLNEVGAGELRLRKLEAKADESAGNITNGLQAAAVALEAERAAQAKRIAALTECEKGVEGFNPLSIEDLMRALADDKAEFEKLQEQLRDAALDELRKTREFVTNYNDKWAEAMGALDDYLQQQQQLLPDLERIWEQFSSREEARRIAEALDEAVEAVSMGVGLVRGAAGGAFRQAARAARQAGGRLEAAAARQAVKQAVEREAAERAVIEAAERQTAQRVSRESAERATSAAARREAAERATREGVERSEREALERARRDVDAAERKIAEGQTQEAARQKAEREALENARRDVDAADAIARRAQAEGDVLRDIQGRNPTRHSTNCPYTTHAAEEGFAGRTKPTAIPAEHPDGRAWLEGVYGDKFRHVGSGAAGKARLDQLLEGSPPGGRGLVHVAFEPNAPYSHLFNGVNRNGFVFYPDAQSGQMFRSWAQVRDIWFLPTH